MQNQLLAILVSLLLVEQVALQSCTTNDFLVSNGVKEYIRINNDGVFACDKKNLCDAFQSLSLSSEGDTLSLSQGNSIRLPDPSSTNELQSLTISGSTLTISNGNSVTLPDQQTLSVSSDNRTISISGGNSVSVPDQSPTNELQTLSLSDTTLSISDSNSIDLNDKKFYMFVLTAIGTTKAASNSPLPVQFNGVAYNNFPASSLSGFDSTFTAPWTGVYRFTLGGGLVYVTSVTNSDYRISVALNATSDYPTNYYHMGWQGQGGVFVVSGSALRVLSAGEVVNVLMYSTNTLTLGPNSNPGIRFFWQGEYLGKY